MGNPIKFIDPDGRSVESTIVTENDDGTYTVTGGDAYDEDNGIYINDGNTVNYEYYGHKNFNHEFEINDFNIYNPYAGTKITDPNGNNTYTWNDALQNPVIQVSGEANITYSSYDSYGRLNLVTNPIGEEFKYTYNDKTGLLASKKVPQQAKEEYWYDSSLNRVASRDGKNQIILAEYDEFYRMTGLYLEENIALNDPDIASPYPDGNFTSYFTDPVFQNKYISDKTYIDYITEGVFSAEGISGSKITDFDYDSYGRVINTLQTFSGGQEGTVEVFPKSINDAGFATENTTKISYSNEPTIEYTYVHSYDELFRPYQVDLNMGGNIKTIEKTVYNGLDQIETKYIGGNEINYLQKVDYKYDGTGRLISINDPENTNCFEELEVCQYYFTNHMNNTEIDIQSCGNFAGIIIDGEEFFIDPDVPIDNDVEIEDFINSVLVNNNYVGSAKVHFHSYISGALQDVEVSILNTNASIERILFENCEFDFRKEDCCSKVFFTGESDPNLVKPDLFFENIFYNGLDIGMIEMGVNCEVGLFENKYTYDKDHRLTKTVSDLYAHEIIPNAYSSNYSYDKAGNIKTLNRKGWVPLSNDYLLIDSLSYTYDQGVSSKLVRIYDATGEEDGPYAKIEGFGKNGNVSAYSYDALGNLLSDSQNKIQDIQYNILNLPTRIEMEGKTVDYEYTFSGEKLARIEDNQSQNAKVYFGGAEFNGSGFSQLHIPNGRISVDENSSMLHYQYHLTDHLGNTIVTFEDINGDGELYEGESVDGLTNEVLQRKHYYSFGLEIKHESIIDETSPLQAYGYNGKESQEDVGMGLLDYSARFYDPAIARFTTIDPLTEQFSHQSGYVYADNDPIGKIDFMGMSGEGVNNPIYGFDGKFLGTDDKGLKGEAIVMDEKFFRQGMKHETATDLGVSVTNAALDGLISAKSLSNIQSHFKSLPSRPDYDGLITNKEAQYWYFHGNGQDLYADISQIDFKSSKLKVGDFAKEGNGTYLSVNFFTSRLSNWSILHRPSTDKNLSHVYGVLGLVLLDPSSGKVRPSYTKRNNGGFDQFDFRNPLVEMVARRNVKGGSPNTYYFQGYGTGIINLE